MFSKFSPAARGVLRAAEQESRNHNHYYIGVEHLLVALLEQHDGAISRRLSQEKIDSGEVHAEARRALGTGDEHPWEGILVTPRVRKVVAIAEERAAGRLIEPIDLLDAILAEGQSAAAAALARARTNGAVHRE